MRKALGDPVGVWRLCNSHSQINIHDLMICATPINPRLVIDVHVCRR